MIVDPTMSRLSAGRLDSKANGAVRLERDITQMATDHSCG
jgi:hypothetical protein